MHMTDSIEATIAERTSCYGEFREVAGVVQALKEVIRSGCSWHRMEPYQREALDMVMNKVGRIVCGNPNHKDSWHDLAGYARLVEVRIGDKPDQTGASHDTKKEDRHTPA